MPALIGWSGTSSPIDSHAWFLFAFLFLWQFPHFLAIALMYREDYARAGYKMLPDFDADGRFTRAEIFALSIFLVGITLWVGVGAGIASVITLSLAGAVLLYPVTSLFIANTRTAAKHVVHASVIYLPVVLIAGMVCKN